MQLCANFP